MRNYNREKLPFIVFFFKVYILHPPQNKKKKKNVLQLFSHNSDFLYMIASQCCNSDFFHQSCKKNSEFVRYNLKIVKKKNMPTNTHRNLKMISSDSTIGNMTGEQNLMICKWPATSCYGNQCWSVTWYSWWHASFFNSTSKLRLPYRDPEASAAEWGCLIWPCCSGTGRWCFSFVGVATPPEWSGRFPAGRAAATAHTAWLTPQAQCRWRASGPPVPPSPIGSHSSRTNPIQIQNQIQKPPARPCLSRRAQSRHGSFIFTTVYTAQSCRTVIECAPVLCRPPLDISATSSSTGTDRIHSITLRGTQEEHADLFIRHTVMMVNLTQTVRSCS